MVRKFLLGLIVGIVIMIIPTAVSASTEVSGNISSDTTWDVAGSPYLITGRVIIDAGKTLTVNPGTVVKVNQACGIEVNGTLNAVGTAEEKIYFTDVRDDSVGGDSDNAAASPGAGWWKGINFYDGSSGSL
ncbi:MAG: hypothetical protein ACM3MK_07995, partial [Chitinophagales bacterium]